MKLMEERWLKCCKIGEGVFTSEVIVSGKTADGREFTLFADKSLVKDMESGKVGLKVTLLNLHGDEAIIVLPDFPFEMNRIVRVKSDDLFSNFRDREVKNDMDKKQAL